MGSGDDSDHRGRERSSSRHHRDGHHDRSSSRHHRRDDRDRRHRKKDEDREERKAREREAEKERARRREERDREERRDRDRERERERERRRGDAGGEGDEDDGRDRKRRRGSSHPRRDAEPEAAPAPRGDEGAEQRRLEDEMERRRSRVKEWQKKRRAQEEGAGAEASGGGEAGKEWTLEGEESDEDGKDLLGAMDVDSKDGGDDCTNNGSAVMEEDEIDPLDAFMNSMVLPEVAKLESKAASASNAAAAVKSTKDAVSSSTGDKKLMGRIMQGEDSDSDYDEAEEDGAGLEDENDEEFLKRVKKTKVDRLAVVDHSKIDYQPFRKNFYIEVKGITEMTSDYLRKWLPTGSSWSSRCTAKMCPTAQSN